MRQKPQNEREDPRVPVLLAPSSSIRAGGPRPNVSPRREPWVGEHESSARGASPNKRLMKELAISASGRHLENTIDERECGDAPTALNLFHASQPTALAVGSPLASGPLALVREQREQPLRLSHIL